MDQTGKVANPARGQLNRKNNMFHVPVRALEFGLAEEVRPSHLVSARSFSTLRLNHQSSIINYQSGNSAYSWGYARFSRRRPYSSSAAVGSVPSLSRHAMLTDGVHCRKCAGTRPVVLKVVPITGEAFSGITMDQSMGACLIPHNSMYVCMYVCMYVYLLNCT